MLEAMGRLVFRLACWLGAVLLLSAACAPTLGQLQQKGFLSIDCGNTVTSYIDSVGLTWVNDASYEGTGSNGVVPYPVSPFRDNYEALQNFRYFAESRSKDCFELPTTSNTSYLIRAMFLHGGSTELVVPTQFSVYINATSLYTVGYEDSGSLNTSVIFEAIIYSPGTVINFCLVPNFGVPFISSLEARPLDKTGTMYSYPGHEKQYLLNLVRWNAGVAKSSPTVRYPDDKFDRLWFTPDGFDSNFKNYTSRGRLDTTTSPAINNVPSAVMKDAWINNAANTSFSYQHKNIPESVTEIYTAAYIQELLSTRNTRGFDIAYNDDFIYSYNATLSADMVWWYGWNIGNAQKTNFTFTAKPWSLHGPVVNAIEVYAQLDFNFSNTVATDVAALASLQTSFRLKNWQGDPCLPVPWNWVECTYYPSSLIARVNKLLLSNMGISGSIPADISKLDALTEIRLNNNSLTGQIPDSLADLRDLTILLLNDNDLSGEVPADLLNSTSLIEFNYVGNKLLGASSPTSPPASPPTSTAPKRNSKSFNIGAIAGGIVGAVVLFAVLISVRLLIRRVLRNRGFRTISDPELKTIEILMDAASAPPLQSPVASCPGSLPSPIRRAPMETGIVSIETVRVATNNFKHKIGVGSYGSVYSGILEGKKVAVKVNDNCSVKRTQEFLTEVDILTRVHHRNLVTLVAYCNEGEHLILIYEYQSKGTLREWLYEDMGTRGSSPNGRLKWPQRLQIAVDAAKGLEYLHNACEPRVVHRDMKSSNILLDSNLVGKVSDFGVSKTTMDTNYKSGGFLTVVKGTIGYFDPEYSATSMLTHKSDVYSFGVVLAEIISGRPPFMEMKDGKYFVLVDKLRRSMKRGDIKAVADPSLEGNYDMQSMWSVVEVALSCLERQGEDRPNISKVVRDLEAILSMDARRAAGVQF